MADLSVALALLLGYSGAAAAAEFVVHISVDGLRVDSMQEVIDAGNAPHFKRLQDEGAWTGNARTDHTHTITLPNHTSMITGRPVQPPPRMPSTTGHGYTSNNTPPSATTIHNYTNPDYYKASTFDVVHDAGLSAAMYASKHKFVLFEQSFNAANGAPHANGSDKIDVYYGPESTASMQTALLSGMASNHFNYTFIHYADTDDAGHGSGWGTTAWRNALATIDGYLGEVLDLIETDPIFAGRTALVLSSDHGGTGTSHGNELLATNYTIPFFAWGAGVGTGDLYAFNSDTRADPGLGRVEYTLPDQPIRNGDGGNLALSLLGLGPIPGSLINADQSLRVALAGDLNLDGTVDAADYVAWRRADVTAQGYATWRANFGNGAGAGGAGHAVPEPAMAFLGSLAWLASFFRRRPIVIAIRGETPPMKIVACCADG